MEAPILAKVIRGKTVESVHRGHLVVIGGDGKVLLEIGNSQTVTFFRSACKPFQALPLITSGAADAFGFDEEEIALACASHSGERIHIEVATRMVEKAGLSENDLQCGTHLPFSEKETERLLRSDAEITQLHNNCSGKHAAMVAVAKHIGADSSTYLSIDHPVQRSILEAISNFCEIPTDKIEVAMDGCCAPNFAMPLFAMARGFLNLITSRTSDPSASRIISAMQRYPELIGGSDRLDTILMKAAPGKIISKVGADGVWLCGILPSDQYPKGASIALKIEDGDDKRARPVAAIELLRRLGILSANDLTEYAPMPIKNRRGELVGHVEVSHQF